MRALKDIYPVVVHVGYANNNQHLTEPSQGKTVALIKDLRAFTNVKILRLRKYTV